VTVNGTDGGGDGIIAIGFAIGYAGLIGWYLMGPSALKARAAAIFALIVGITAYADYNGLKGDATGAVRDTITAGWGLLLVGIASGIAFVLAAAMSFTAWRKSRPAPYRGPQAIAGEARGVAGHACQRCGEQIPSRTANCTTCGFDSPQRGWA
jgi:hypothetical protein